MTTNRRRPAVALSAIALVLLAGCSSGNPDAEPTPDPEDARAAAPTEIEGGGEPAGNGISGLIAAASESLMQVQGTDSQTAVTWTEDTVITRTILADLDTLATGSCVVAMAPAAEEGSPAGAATTVTVSDPVDGECTVGFGGAGGPGGPMSGAGPEGWEPPEGMDLPEGGGMPEGREPPEGTERPDGGDGMAGAFGQVVVGQLTDVSDSALTVETTDADGVAATEIIAVDAETAITATVTADPTAIAVGLCAAVRGEPDTRGGMAATTITLSDPGENGCTGPMVGRPTDRPGDE